MEKIDLHTHTNMSDGLLSPEQLVKSSLENNCKKIAITDHEIIKDYKYLEEEYGIEITNGVEFNTSVRNMHLLGYGVEDIYALSKRIDEVRHKNEEVCYKVIDMMKKSGYDISISKIIDYLKENRFNHEIIDKRKIVKYLIHKGYATGVVDAYNNLLGYNQEFYIPNYKITPEETIKMVEETGGISVWAHPYSVTTNDKEIYKIAQELKEYGLCGIEIINKKINSHNNTLIDIANSLDLTQTVGSDFHNPEEDKLGINVDERIYESFQKKLILKK